MRLRREEILDHFQRGLIYGYILANPGEHYRAIKRALNLNNGSLTYHLNVLEKEGFIKSKRDSVYKRFYPMDMRIPANNGTGLSLIRKTIFGIIEETPVISQKDIASFLGVSSATINYHIGKLIKGGVVRSERMGKKVCYFKVKVPGQDQT